jgi:hypothetical protein
LNLSKKDKGGLRENMAERRDIRLGVVRLVDQPPGTSWAEFDLDDLKRIGKSGHKVLELVSLDTEDITFGDKPKPGDTFYAYVNLDAKLPEEVDPHDFHILQLSSINED